MKTLLEARGLNKQYRREDGSPLQALADVDLAIRRGEIYGLLGPNGAGKTTLISIISGLMAPDSGQVVIGGHDLNRDPLSARGLLGVVPQELALYEDLSARQNLRFFGRLCGLRGPELEQRVDETLEFVDLADRQRERASRFSGGMKRRLNIGIGLLHRPQLVYMDEPTVGVDPQSRRRILDSVLRLRADHGMTVLYTTHLMEEAQELSDRVGIIDHGRLIAEGTVGDLVLQAGEQDRLEIDLVESGRLDAALLQELERALSGAARVQSGGPIEQGRILVHASRGRQILSPLITALGAAGLEVRSVTVQEPNLETVFLQMTGHALRD
ncbi:MAG: ABC transporter ATP-binding protein [Anaerolineaceae bacterium]|nr:ABC transporter ATP-binding protein [Anaerolineaceae bacterium]MDE0329049.1 ABC transporter ATP-binding protein [Anaerolineaceae bacterium]